MNSPHAVAMVVHWLRLILLFMISIMAFYSLAVGLRNALQLEIGDIRRKADLTQPKPKTPAVKEENKPTKKERSSMDTLDLTIKMCNKPWKAEAWPNLLYDATLLPEGLNSEGEICGTFPLDPMFGLEQEPLQDKMKVRSTVRKFVMLLCHMEHAYPESVFLIVPCPRGYP